MSYLILGIVIFAGIHLFSMLAPASRDGLANRLGEGPWKGIYSLISLTGLVLMIYGWSLTRSDPEGSAFLYNLGEWTRHAAMLLVLIAFILIGASHGKGNIKHWVKQPMSIGIGLWALAHLLANGQCGDILLFGTFVALAVLDIVLSTLRGKVPHYQPSLRSDVIAIVVGIVLYLIFLFGFHPYILNVPVVA